MKDLTKKVLERLKKEDPDVSGNVQIAHTLNEKTQKRYKHSYNVWCDLDSSLDNVEDLVEECIKDYDSKATILGSYKIRKDNNLNVSYIDSNNEPNSNNDLPELDDDEKHYVRIINSGMMSTGLLEPNKIYKRRNLELFDNVQAIYRNINFLAPIIVDQNLKVIDGDLRLSIAKMEKRKEVPVIVVEADEEKANFLRLSLNRSSEFQRWNYDEVDPFIDSNVAVSQKLLEPLGLFGKYTLPKSFFGNTVISNYHFEDKNNQQKMYLQDIGLAEWAEKQFLEKQKENNDKKESRRKRPKERSTSLFDVEYEKEDLEETYDPGQVMSETVEESKKTAEEITQKYDKIRKEHIEAKGGEWQTRSRTTREQVNDIKAEEKMKALEKETEELIDEPVSTEGDNDE